MIHELVLANLSSYHRSETSKVDKYSERKQSGVAISPDNRKTQVQHVQSVVLDWSVRRRVHGDIVVSHDREAVLFHLDFLDDLHPVWPLGSCALNAAATADNSQLRPAISPRPLTFRG